MSVSHGLEKIIQRILDQASGDAREKERLANEEAERILTAAREEASDIVSAAERKAAEASEAYADLRKNTDEQHRKLSLLKVRNAVIDEVLDEAYRRILDLDDEAYFGMLLKLLGERVSAGEGVIRLNARDLARVPADFAERAGEAAAAAGGSVRIAEEAAGIDGGFILAYGDIEENASLSAVFASRREELRDRVNGILFR